MGQAGLGPDGPDDTLAAAAAARNRIQHALAYLINTLPSPELWAVLFSCFALCAIFIRKAAKLTSGRPS